MSALCQEFFFTCSDIWPSQLSREVALNFIHFIVEMGLRESKSLVSGLTAEAWSQDRAVVSYTSSRLFPPIYERGNWGSGVGKEFARSTSAGYGGTHSGTPVPGPSSTLRCRSCCYCPALVFGKENQFHMKLLKTSRLSRHCATKCSILFTSVFLEVF